MDISVGDAVRYNRVDDLDNEQDADHLNEVCVVSDISPFRYGITIEFRDGHILNVKEDQITPVHPDAGGDDGVWLVSYRKPSAKRRTYGYRELRKGTWYHADGTAYPISDYRPEHFVGPIPEPGLEDGIYRVTNEAVAHRALYLRVLDNVLLGEDDNGLSEDDGYIIHERIADVPEGEGLEMIEYDC